MEQKNTKEQLTEDTVIGSRKISAAEFRKFFKKMLGDDYEKIPIVRGVIKTSMNHKGKTLKEIIAECNDLSGSKNLEEILSENRFKIISASDREFIIDFDKVITERGYDFGGAIVGNKDLMAIVYGKTGTKTRTRPACFHIDNDGTVCLKLYLHKVADHQRYIENTPTHIKEIFTNDTGKCNGCNFRNGKCKYNCTKTYTVDGRLYRKCYFHVADLATDNVSGYMELLAEFYPMKK